MLVHGLGTALSPPLVAVAVAVVVGLVPALHALLFGPDAPLRLTVTATLASLGACTVPCILLTLGAQVRAHPPRVIKDHRTPFCC
jgi:predicted permease